MKCNSNGAEADSTKDLDGAADQVNESNPLDTNPAGRHAESTTASDKPAPTATGKAFQA